MTKTQKIDNALDGLSGPVKVGKKYYFFTVTYAYIGVVDRIMDDVIVLSAPTASIVSTAGSASDAVSQIVQGKVSPESWEHPATEIFIMRQALTAFIPMAK